MRHENHDDDIGFFTGEERAKRQREREMEKRREALRKKEKRQNKKSILTVLGVMVFFFADFAAFPVLLIVNLGEQLFSGYSDNGGFRLFAYIAICIVLLFVTIRMFRSCSKLSNQFLVAAGVLPAIGILLALYTELRSPVQDLYYYGALFVNLFVILFLELILVGRYNRFVTEEVPNYFEAGSNPKLEHAPSMSISDKAQGTAKNRVLYGITVVAAALMLVAAVVRTSDVDWRAFVTETSHTIDVLAGKEGNAGGDNASAEDAALSPENGVATAVSLTGNELIIDDRQDLLTADEELRLRQSMAPLLEYGNVAFVSERPMMADTGLAAAKAYDRMFKEKDGTLFYFDMQNRKIFIYSMGAVLKIVSKGYANTITDNIYKYASNGNYCLCAQKAFEQIYTVLDGGKIAQPMKHLSNAFLSVILGLLAGYGIVLRTVAGRGKPGIEMIGGAGGLGAAIMVAQHGDSFYRTRKRRRESGGGSGHYGGHSGGFGGGGGFSGGGGSHGGFSGGGGGHSF